MSIQLADKVFEYLFHICLGRKKRINIVDKYLFIKQSKFKDSDRYYRGQILKHLLEDTLLVSDVSVKYNIDNDRAEKIVQSMVKDNVVVVKDKQLMLRE